jgi:DNA polymerase-3 subunit delta'
MSFEDIKDQVVPVRLLRNIVARRRIPNGLLFWGPGGVGKRLTALEMAKAINCASPTAGMACDTCLPCRKIGKGHHPDVKTITPSGKARNIAVDTIDFISDLSSYRPFESDWRIFLIQDVDRMGEPAQNHFLKTLEEPPSQTLFILMTEFPRILLPTIRSRCQQLRFGALRPETVTTLLLKERKLSPDAAASIASVSQGQMSRALDLVDTDKRTVVLDMTHRLRKGEDPLALSAEFVGHLKANQDAIKMAIKAESSASDMSEFSKEDRDEQEKAQTAYVESLIRKDLMEYLYLFQTWYRDALVFRSTRDPQRILNRDQTDRLTELANDTIPLDLGAVEKAWRYIERNLNIDRVFRDLFFALTP